MRTSQVLRQVDPVLPGGGDTPDPQPVSVLASGRASSVTFRPSGTRSSEASTMLDPANQSLADALNVLLKLIYVGVAAMGLFYLFSGTKRVQEGQRGIRLSFGKVVDDGLEPGLHWAMPFPFGQIEVVGQGVQTVDVKRDFWVYLPENTREDESFNKLVPTLSLKPNQGGSGSVITGDGALAHVRVSAQYRRSNAEDYARNVLPDQEQEIVVAAVKRGVVQAIAQTTIDDLLRQGNEQGESVSRRVQVIAQEGLDASQTGIVIERVAFSNINPPRTTLESFDRVQKAVSDGQKSLERARTDANKVLSESAGEAADYVLAQINNYESAIATKDAAKQTATLADIDAVFRGREVDAGGRKVRVSGNATKLVSGAELYRTQVVSQSKSNLARYKAKLDQFQNNPLVMVNQEWRTAREFFAARSTVHSLVLPPGGVGDVLTLRLNRDPAWMRTLEKAVKEREMMQAEADTMDKLRREGITTSVETPTSAN